MSRSGSIYRFNVPAQAAGRLVSGFVPTSTATGSAELSDGSIVHLALDFPKGNQVLSIALDYSSIGSAPPVTVPAGS